MITEDLLTTFGITLVVRGSVSETRGTGVSDAERRYGLARAKGIYRWVRGDLPVGLGELRMGIGRAGASQGDVPVGIGGSAGGTRGSAGGGWAGAARAQGVCL